ncbi:hypothetical protein Pyn_23244 [Prunus yedoensis var. nudiflora]|uniref:Uncharacterized protein n=1 Tax=Prunus yedoensis var. nudiflora TaxID=2094558 RepID=A0A314XUE6_PRUYE|nr:hypothetical protein Pyn_23244 [Prunus yedoensis var. nudiflora]
MVVVCNPIWNQPASGRGARGPCTTSFVLYDGIGYPQLVAGIHLGKESWGTFTPPPWWPVRMIELFVCHFWCVSW